MVIRREQHERRTSASRERGRARDQVWVEHPRTMLGPGPHLEICFLQHGRQSDGTPSAHWASATRRHGLVLVERGWLENQHLKHGDGSR